MKNVLADMPLTTPAPQTLIQRDGTPTTPSVKPTKTGIQAREASPRAYMTSGIERAMGTAADSLHKVGKSRRTGK